MIYKVWTVTFYSTKFPIVNLKEYLERLEYKGQVREYFLSLQEGYIGLFLHS